MPYRRRTFHFRLCDSRVNITFDLVARDGNPQVLKPGFIRSFQEYSHCNFEVCSFTSLISRPRQDYQSLDCLTAQIKHCDFDHM